MTANNDTSINLADDVQKMFDDGATKAKIEGFLMYVHSLTVNQAKTLVQTVCGKGASSGSADWADTISFIRENYGKISKAELIAGMCDIKGAKPSSMNHAYNYIKFAREFAAQEVAAALESTES